MTDKQKKHAKRLLPLVLLSVAVMVISVLGSSAVNRKHLTALVNLFSFRTAKVEITEPGVDPSDVPWGADTKPVYLSVPANGAESVVRATVVPSVKDAAGNYTRHILGELSEPVDNRIVMGDITLVFDSAWSANWIYKDGTFYYKKTLSAGETSAQLLSGVVLTNDTPEKRAQYSGSTVEIEVISDAVQASADAPAVWGASVDSSGNVTLS